MFRVCPSATKRKSVNNNNTKSVSYKLLLFTFSEFPILLVMGRSELGQVVVNFVWAMLALKREENRDEHFIWLDRGDKIMRRKT